MVTILVAPSSNLLTTKLIIFLLFFFSISTHTHTHMLISRMDARSHCWTLPFAKSEKPINGQIYYAVLRLGDSAQTADTGIAVTARQNGASNVSVFQCVRKLFG
jgi:hypothetical protein